jgi:hypothetical protein
MSTIDDELESLKAKLQALTDRAELAQLCDGYLLHLDLDRADDSWLGSVFTEDAHVIFPMGEYKGMDGLLAFQEMARANFVASHHVGTTSEIKLDGDRARVRVHLTAVHIAKTDEPQAHFDIGGHYEADAVRTPDGWRLSTLNFSLVWSSGGTPQTAAAGIGH